MGTLGTPASVVGTVGLRGATKGHIWCATGGGRAVSTGSGVTVTMVGVGTEGVAICPVGSGVG